MRRAKREKLDLQVKLEAWKVFEEAGTRMWNSFWNVGETIVSEFFYKIVGTLLGYCKSVNS